MRQRIPALISSMCGLALIGSVAVSTNSALADDCVATPTPGAPQGSHWYYKTDRATNLKCWYLRTDNAAQDGSDTATDDTAGANDAQAPVPVVTPPRPAIAPRPAQHVVRDSVLAQAAGAFAPAPTYTAAYVTPLGWPAPTGVGATAEITTADITNAGPAPWMTMQLSADDASSQNASASSMSGMLPAAAVVEQQVSAQPTAPQEAQPQVQSQVWRSQQPPTPELVALTARAQSQLESQSSEDNGLALGLLRTGIQRLTSSSGPAEQGNHSLALVTTALAFVAIAIGIIVATRWSLRRSKQNKNSDISSDFEEQRITDTDMTAVSFDGQSRTEVTTYDWSAHEDVTVQYDPPDDGLDAPMTVPQHDDVQARDFSAVDLSAADLSTADLVAELDAIDLGARELSDRAFAVAPAAHLGQVAHQVAREGAHQVARQDVLGPGAFAGQASSEALAPAAHHIFKPAIAALEAARPAPRDPSNQNSWTAASEKLNFEAGLVPQPVLAIPSFLQRPREHSRALEPVQAEPALVTKAVESTLRHLLDELDSKPARPQLVHPAREPEQRPAAADDYGVRNRMKRA
jgi:hypothetical protein